ncbi:MAG: hypothetical protein QGH63_01140, partial [Rhodospirillales bacterium]|nr:hypothetical protein [Rhodospirillales bacterium]
MKGAFGSGDTESIRGCATEIAESPEKVGKHWVYHETSLRDETKKLINRIENMTPFHRGLAELTACLLPSVGQLLGEE